MCNAYSQITHSFIHFLISMYSCLLWVLVVPQSSEQNRAHVLTGLTFQPLRRETVTKIKHNIMYMQHRYVYTHTRVYAQVISETSKCDGENVRLGQWGRGSCCFICMIIRESLPGRVVFEQRPEGSEEKALKFLEGNGSRQKEQQVQRP